MFLTLSSCVTGCNWYVVMAPLILKKKKKNMIPLSTVCYKGIISKFLYTKIETWYIFKKKELNQDTSVCLFSAV